MAIQTYVAQHPGESTRTIAGALGLNESTANYHLRRLQKAGKCVVHASARERWWFEAGRGYCPVLRHAIPILRRAEALAVARALSTTPATSGEVATASGVPVSQTRWIGVRLEETLIAQKSRAGWISLRDDANVCLEKAARAEPCDKWGKCPLAAEWTRRVTAGVPLTSEGSGTKAMPRALAPVRPRLAAHEGKL